MGMATILINGPWIFVQIFNPHVKFEENLPRDFRREVVQKCGRTTDDGRQVITITHPEPAAQVS